MLLNDISKPITSNILSEMLYTYFNYSIPLDKLTNRFAQKLLESANNKITEIKNSDAFYMSETNSTYLGVLTT